MSLDFLANSPIGGAALQWIGVVDDPEEVRNKRRREGQALADARAFQQFYRNYDFSTPTAADLLENYGYQSAGGAMGEDFLMRLLSGEFDTYSGWGMPGELVAQSDQDRLDALNLIRQFNGADTPIQDASPQNERYQWEEYKDPYEDSWLGKAEKFYEAASSGSFQDIARNMSDESDEYNEKNRGGNGGSR